MKKTSYLKTIQIDTFYLIRQTGVFRLKIKSACESGIFKIIYQI